MGRPLGRLKRREDFLAVAATRIKMVMPGFILQMRSRPGGHNGIRVGFTASRKVGGAVVRNRTKRRLRALANPVLGDIGLPGTDYVLIGRRDTASMPFKRLQQDLHLAMKRMMPLYNKKRDS